MENLPEGLPNVGIDVPPNPTTPIPTNEVWDTIQDGAYAIVLMLIFAGYLSRGKIWEFFSKLSQTQEILAENQKLMLKKLEDLEGDVDLLRKHDPYQ